MKVRHEHLLRNICRLLGVYTCADVSEALKDHQRCVVRGRYKSITPTERQIVWILSHATWSRTLKEGNRKARCVYEYIEPEEEANGHQ